MNSKLIEGKVVSTDIREKLSVRIEKLKEQGITPGLAVVLVGHNPASQSYVRSKERACEQMGITSFDNRLSESTTEEELLTLIDRLNNDDKVDGILVQLPLPSHIDEEKVLQHIKPSKDVDGFHPVSVGNLVLGRDTFIPCTPYGIVKLLEFYNIETSGKKVAVIGRSNIVGKPISLLLAQKGKDATVTICHSRTKNLKQELLNSDIIVAAIGRPEFVEANMVRDGAVVVDVGINRVEDASKKRGYRLVGDVDFEAVQEKASYITPVPGGVGPMTITMLLSNTVEAAEKRRGSGNS